MSIMERTAARTAIAIAAVFVGGAIGTAVRWTLGIVFPSDGGLPVTFAINVTGAFLLGALAEARRGASSSPRSQLILAFAGTGVLGGYTTYGTFAINTDGLIDTASTLGGVLYGGIGIALGAAAAGFGLFVVDAIRRRVRGSGS